MPFESVAVTVSVASPASASGSGVIVSMLPTTDTPTNAASLVTTENVSVVPGSALNTSAKSTVRLALPGSTS